MRLTLHTDYALRMLIYLAIQDGKTCRVSDVAASYGLSHNHLLKVALKLGKLGHIHTSRGRAGGIALARRPSEINLGAVIRKTEDDFALVECLRADGGGCVIAPVCRLKSVVSRAIETFYTVFDDYTVADLVENRTILGELLNIGSQTGKTHSMARPRSEETAC